MASGLARRAFFIFVKHFEAQFLHTSWDRSAGRVCQIPQTATHLLRYRSSMDWDGVHAVDHQDWSRLTAELGAHRCEDTVTFAVYSRNATRVQLELFDKAIGSPARCSFELAKGSNDTFRGAIRGLPRGVLYGYRCWGPNWHFDGAWTPGSIAGFVSDVDDTGNRFNPNKLLLDPYARELSHDSESPQLVALGHNAGMYGSGQGLYVGLGLRPIVRRVFDTAPYAPKGMVIVDATSTGTKPRIPQQNSVIYEAHLRGLTKHPSASRLETILAGEERFGAVKNVPPEYRGTYKGAAYMAPYLAALGVTILELLPIHESCNDINTQEPEHELDTPSGNYWGYMNYGYFAPDRRYAYDRSPGGPTREFKEMIRAFHDHGVEVYLDVVFNHTAEGGIWDSDPNTAEVLSFRGLDNASYYALAGEARHYYWVSTGCGNNLNCSSPVVQKFILDSLEYWATEMGVDGFRFDLATVLGRDQLFHFDFRGGSPMLSQIAELAERLGIEVVAESWDTSNSTVGAFPSGWAEWNGRFRDVLRRFCRGELGLIRDFAEVVNGDYANFADQGGPHKSINFVVAHDGFTLLDLVSYNQKHNLQAWPFGPSDGGSDENLAWDSDGLHGLRRQRMRNFLVLQMFARGVPMIGGGDEYGRTQNGNNNPYKIDSVGMWHNYAAIASDSPTAIPTEGHGAYHDNFGSHSSGHNGWFRFVERVIQLRKRHPTLRQATYGDFDPTSGGDVTMLFRGPNGSPELYHGNAVAWLIYGQAVADTDFAILVNMSTNGVGFVIPEHHGPGWRRIIDTAEWAESADNHWLDAPDPTLFTQGSDYWVSAHSVVVFQLY